MRRALTGLIVFAALLLALVPPLGASSDGCMDMPCCSRMPCPEAPSRSVEAASCCRPAETPALPASDRGATTLLPTSVKHFSFAAAALVTAPSDAAASPLTHTAQESLAPRVELFTLHASLLI